MEKVTRERVLDALCAIRCGAADTEEALHKQAGDALRAAGFLPEHEKRLGPRCRIDFLVGEIGIEIKKSRPQRSALISQLSRYAQCGQIEELIVIAPRGVDMPAMIGGKRVTMLSLERLWGIWLP